MRLNRFMNRFKQMPKIMVAPNGARKTKKDHFNLPISISEVVNEARACFINGANTIHAHVRDSDGKHTLDIGLYLELIKEMILKVPDMPVQITTEAIGQFSPQDQSRVVKAVKPECASVALIEMMPDIQDTKIASEFYNYAFENNIQIQHILYSPTDLKQLIESLKRNLLPKENLQLLYVLGRYSGNFQSRPSDLKQFLDLNDNCLNNAEWSVCAFGNQETDCLLKAISLGGNIRVGFENNFYNKDGSLAESNAERVSEIVNLIKEK